ncbi:HGGxSTG domain-containing protein [Pantoea sp.]|uniref:HGGxSTG domain-containing protein n=1 Tax=Pantoea sp. TaxID=69393 RepID=UPI0028ADFEC3|nr:HGGxSTG domain-containing protein [Pantoea sp.]
MDNKEKVRLLRLRAAMWRSHNAAWRRYIEQRDEMTTSNILASLIQRKKCPLELPVKPVEPYYPDTSGFTCGATTRAGTPCKRKDIYSNGRCKFHGGMSTGAKTAEGKARQLAGYRRWLDSKVRDSE